MQLPRAAGGGHPAQSLEEMASSDALGASHLRAAPPWRCRRSSRTEGGAAASRLAVLRSWPWCLVSM